MDTHLILYAVRNSKGQFFHARGFSGYGESWVKDLKKARIYAKPGPARAVITYFSNDDAFPVPELVELHVTNIVAVNEEKRVQDSKARKASQEVRGRLARLQAEKEELEERLAQDKKRLRQLQGECR